MEQVNGHTDKQMTCRIMTEADRLVNRLLGVEGRRDEETKKRLWVGWLVYLQRQLKIALPEPF